MNDRQRSNSVKCNQQVGHIATKTDSCLRANLAETFHLIPRTISLRYNEHMKEERKTPAFPSIAGRTNYRLISTERLVIRSRYFPAEDILSLTIILSLFCLGFLLLACSANSKNTHIPMAAYMIQNRVIHAISCFPGPNGYPKNKEVNTSGQGLPVGVYSRDKKEAPCIEVSLSF